MSASSVRHSAAANRTTRGRRTATTGRRRVSSCQPEDGFIVSDKAWCARTDNGLYIDSQAISQVLVHYCRRPSLLCAQVNSAFYPQGDGK